MRGLRFISSNIVPLLLFGVLLPITLSGCGCKQFPDADELVMQMLEYAHAEDATGFERVTEAVEGESTEEAMDYVNELIRGVNLEKLAVDEPEGTQMGAMHEVHVEFPDGEILVFEVIVDCERADVFYEPRQNV